jgi:hypothetical protein
MTAYIYTPLGAPGASKAYALDINDFGQLIGNYTESNKMEI